MAGACGYGPATASPAGRDYSDAFGDWLLSYHLNLPAPARARLLVLMGNLAEIEQWRLTLTPTQHSGCG